MSRSKRNAIDTTGLKAWVETKHPKCRKKRWGKQSIAAMSSNSKSLAYRHYACVEQLVFNNQHFR